jgi:hypothetical protein
MDPDLIKQWSWCEPSFFGGDAFYQAVWSAMHALGTQGHDVSIHAIAQRVERDTNSEWHTTDTFETLLKLQANGGIPDYTGEHALKVLKLAQQREKVTAFQAYGMQDDPSELFAAIQAISAWGPNSDKAPDNLICYADAIERDIVWLWRHHIALGKLTDVIGYGGVGKSTILAGDLAARITRGMPMPDGQPGQLGTVIYVSAEDGLEDTMVPRFRLAGGDLNRMFQLPLTIDDQKTKKQRMLDLSRDVLEVERMIKRVGALVVIIDPVTAYLGSKDSYKDAEVRAVLAPYAEMAERLGVAILTIRHVTKGGHDRVAYSGSGSGAFSNLARTQIIMMEDPDDESCGLFGVSKMNIGPKGAMLRYRIVPSIEKPDIGIVEWLGESEMTAQEAHTKSRTPKEKPASQSSQMIIGVLEGQSPNPMSPGDVAARLGRPNAVATSQAMARMAERGEIAKAAYGLYCLTRDIDVKPVKPVEVVEPVKPVKVEFDNFDRFDTLTGTTEFDRPSMAALRAPIIDPVRHNKEAIG